MAHTKSAYWVEFKHKYHANQYFTLSEFKFIRKCLNEGRIITRLEKVNLSIDQYRHEFGI